MVNHSTDNVLAAFDLLLHEIAVQTELMNSAGADAFKRGDHASVERALRRVQMLQSITDDVLNAKSNWDLASADIASAHGLDAKPTHGPLVHELVVEPLPPRAAADRVAVRSQSPPPFDVATEKLVAHNPRLRDLLAAIYREVMAVCPGAEFYSNSKWINFRCKENFLVLVAQKRRFSAGIAVGEGYRHPRLALSRSRGGHGGWYGWGAKYQGIQVSSINDLDDEFRKLIQVACKANGPC